MALVNHAKREINAKLVYYGPGRAGKTTSLNYIYRKLKAEHRGKLKAMNIGKARMLFFDFAPAGQARVGTYDVRFHVYSIIGEATNATAWKMVLKGADGVVFVADSTPERLSANRKSLQNLQQTLGAYGKELADLPGVLQCNKRDLAAALPTAELQSRLNPGHYTVVPAVATRGEGVLESLSVLMKAVLKTLRESGLELEREAEPLAGLTTAMPAGHEEEPHGVEPPVTHEAKRESPAPSTPYEEVVATSRTLTATESDEAIDGEPEILLAGQAEAIGSGRLRLPLKIRLGKKEMDLTLTVELGQ